MSAAEMHASITGCDGELNRTFFNEISSVAGRAFGEEDFVGREVHDLARLMQEIQQRGCVASTVGPRLVRKRHPTASCLRCPIAAVIGVTGVGESGTVTDVCKPVHLSSR